MSIAHASGFEDFDLYQQVYTKEQIEKKIATYLLKDPEIANYFSISEDAFLLYESPEAKTRGKEEFRLRFGQKSPPAKRIGKEGLKGVKIALDPGHFGGYLSRLEQRFVEIESEDKKVLSFDEGTLTLLTALFLKDFLEKEGAEVFLTRQELASGAIEKGYYDWLQDHPQWQSIENQGKVFREVYNPLDLKRRAQKINAFSPDLTVIIHYNAHEEPEERRVTERNYNMVFLPGSFCRNELSDKTSRYEFVRLLVSDDIEQSEKFCRIVIEKMKNVLSVPSVSEEEGIRYLKNSSLEIASGVYARNLCLTRLVHGPLCYGESLVQNNRSECQLLAKQEEQIGSRKAPFRVKQVAIAYFLAIQEYFSSKGRTASENAAEI
jgi:N-acetylmuramoyl-L-alanine amidase